MIRKFLECRNNEERFELFSHSFDFQWTQEEMNTIYEILGLEVPKKELTHEEMYRDLFYTLKNKKVA